ncbi:MAG: LPS export ABC transporter periplasmic protein LptC [Pseudomonadota bacterium]|nr:LPS export ABC transporter periplasmic protein LptC [Pseudomonadota bacterium]
MIPSLSPHADPIIRHSRAVGWLRLVLPLIIAAWLALLIAWPLMTRPDAVTLGERSNLDAEMVGTHYKGTDRHGRPFTITADTVSRLPNGEEQIALGDPEAQISLADNAWLSMLSRAGVYDETSKRLLLSNGVEGFHDRGYNFTTARMNVDLATGIATGDDPVTAHGPCGRVEAAGIRIVDDGKRMIFIGPAVLVLRSHIFEVTP